MVLNSVDVLIDALRESKLLRPELFAQLSTEIAGKYEDPQELAKHVVKLGWLTLYQAKKLLAGHGHELVLGNYVILDKVGEGGMGKVYKAKQLRMSRTVALKVIRPNLLTNETALKRFHREAKAAAQLAHPNIVRLFDADQIGNRHFLAMEYVEGVDLARMVKDSGLLPIGMASSFVRQTASGLQHAHDQGLVHRDIKPSNLLVTALSKSPTGSDGVVKILDMGLARATSNEDDGSDISALTQTGTVIGTPDYMSPEQAKNSSTVDARSDLYSLGCTLYYLLTGQPPFPQGSTLEKLLQHQMDAPPQIQLKRHDIPDELAGIIHKLLAKRPDHRFQSGTALATALEPWSGIDPNGQLGEGRRSARMAVVPQALPVANSHSEHSVDAKTESDPFDFDNMQTPAAPAPTVRAARIDEETAESKLLAKNSSLIWWLVGAGGGMVLLVVVLILMRGGDKKPQSQTPKQDDTPIAKEDPSLQPKKDTNPPKKEVPSNKLELEQLDAYLPTDTTAAIVVNLPQVIKLGPIANRVLSKLEPILTQLKIKPFLRSIERIVVAIGPQDGKHVFIIQGQSSLTNEIRRWANEWKFKRYEEKPSTGAYSAFEVRFDQDQPPTYMALIGNHPTSIVLAPSRDRLREVLARADEFSAGRARKPFSDSSIPQSLSQYDQKSSAIWACIGTQIKPPNNPKSSGLQSDFGINTLIGCVDFNGGMEFDAFIEATSYERASAFFVIMQGIFGLKGKGDDLRMEHLKQFVTRSKPVSKSGTKSLGPNTLHVRWHLKPQEFVEWLKPFLSDLPNFDSQ